jgi:hypothetical protein
MSRPSGPGIITSSTTRSGCSSRICAASRRRPRCARRGTRLRQVQAQETDDVGVIVRHRISGACASVSRTSLLTIQHPRSYAATRGAGGLPPAGWVLPGRGAASAGGLPAGELLRLLARQPPSIAGWRTMINLVSSSSTFRPCRGIERLEHAAVLLRGSAQLLRRQIRQTGQRFKIARRSGAGCWAAARFAERSVAARGVPRRPERGTEPSCPGSPR